MPRWAGADHAVRPLVNARAETLLEKPSFREAAKRRRCIVPASGFYEWRKAGRERMPCYFTRRDGEPLSFAGIWESSPSPRGPVETCVIVTVGANSRLAPLHDRMPAILAPDQEADWLDAARIDGSSAVSMLRPAPEDWLDMREVSPRMNRQSVNDPDCIVPAPHLSQAAGESLSLFGGDW